MLKDKKTLRFDPGHHTLSRSCLPRDSQVLRSCRVARREGQDSQAVERTALYVTLGVVRANVIVVVSRPHLCVCSIPTLSFRRFRTYYLELGIAERVMDWHATTVKMTSWLRGFWEYGGFVGAHRAAAGLA